MTLTSNAFTKNENRSNHIQADTLATKGSDYLVAIINYRLSHAVEEVMERIERERQNATLNKQQYNAYSNTIAYMNEEFDKILADYSCSNPHGAVSTINSAENKYEYCVIIGNPEVNGEITDDPTTWYTIKMEGTPLKRIIVLKSTGDVKSSKVASDLFIRKVIGLEISGEDGNAAGEGDGSGGIGEDGEIDEESNNIGDDIPVDLVYAISTQIMGVSNNKNEDGALFLHGGVDVYGDIKVEGNLYVGDYGMPGDKDYYFSSYPRVFALRVETSLSAQSPGKVFAGGVVYRWNVTSAPSNSNHSNYLKKPLNYVNNYKLQKVNNGIISVGQGFSNNNVEVTSYNEEAQSSKVAFDKIKAKFLNAFEAKNIRINNNCSASSLNNQSFEYCGNSLTVSSTLSLVKSDPNSADLSQRGGILYSKGLTVNGGSATLHGTFFVDGDVYFKSADVYADAVMYVTGKVTFENSYVYSHNYMLNS